MALFRANSTRKDLNDWLSQDPGKGADNYSSQIGAALANAANRAPAAQRYNTGADPNIQASRTNYRLMAQAAAANAAQGTKDLSGGYDASYADSAAAQGYQQIMEGQHNNEEALRQLALEGMAAGDNQADMLTAALLGAQQLETSANQMAQNRYQAQRDFLTNEADQAQAEEDNFWSNVWNSLVWAADVAMKTYDNAKGYSQQQWENEFAREQWEAQQAQAEWERQRYDTEYADSRADAAWSQGITEQQLAAELLAMQDDHTLSRLQAQQLQRALAAGVYSGGGGGSSGGTRSLSVSDLLAIREARQKAELMGNQEDVAFYDWMLGEAGIPSGTTGTVGWNASSGKSLDSGFAAARDAFRYGATDNQVTEQLTMQGYTPEEIAEILNRFSDDV